MPRGHASGVDPRTVALGLGVNRVLFGLGYLLSPRSTVRSGFGVTVRPGSWPEVFVRGHGARDVWLGLTSLLALQRGDESAARLLYAAHAAADGVDLATVLAASRSLPARGVAFGVLACGAPVVGGTYAALRLGRG